MSRRFLVLQHIACEPPGAFEDELRAWGGELERVEVDEGERLPDWREFTRSSRWAGRWALMRTSASRGWPLRSG
jgi:hypothetical protein